MQKIPSNVFYGNITELKENEIFAFGSNLSGIHGAGAAKTALQWGAVYGNGQGRQGNTYAIPTKGLGAKAPLPLDEVGDHINTFLNYAIIHPELDFFVTEIGCGYAGFNAPQIAPFFRNAIRFNNIILPLRFATYLALTSDSSNFAAYLNILKVLTNNIILHPEMEKVVVRNQNKPSNG